MHLLNKLEKIFGRFAVKNLMLYIVVGTSMVYVLSTIRPDILEYIYFIPPLVTKGEIWRLISFIFIPPNTSLIFIFFILYFYYFIGSGLEQEWGSFKFNVYYLIGTLATIIAAFVTNGIGTSIYLNLSLFLAFAYIYPNYEILFMFILPIKIKYLAWLDVVLLAVMFFMGDLSSKVFILVAFANFFLFFGFDIYRTFVRKGSSYVRKSKYKSAFSYSKKKPFHRCHVCGITEIDDKTMEFRYCMSCEGRYEYCLNHLKNHEHIKKNKF